MQISLRAWMPARRGISRTVAATFSALLVMASPVAAAPGDLTDAGCFRDFESTFAGCTTAQGLDAGWGVAASADGRNVYSVSNADDTIVTFERDPLTGALAYRGCIRHSGRTANGCTLAPALDGPMGVTVSADGEDVYVSADISDAVTVFSRDATTGALSFAGCVRDAEVAQTSCASAQGLDGPRDVALSPDGGTIYVASAFDDAVVHFTRDLVFRGCVRDTANTGPGCAAAAGLDGPRGVAVSSDGADVYVASRDGDAIAAFRRAGDGALSWSGCFRDAEQAPGPCRSAQGLYHPHGIAISPDGTSVYFPAEYDDAVAAFQRDAATGELTYRGCLRDSAKTPNGCTSAEGFDGARQVEVSPDGRSVYVTGADDDALVQLARDTGTGALTWAGCVRDVENAAGGCAKAAQGLDNVRAVAISADGKSVYGASELDDAVVRFDREPVVTEPPPPPPPPPADTTAPAVTWTAPASGATVSGSVACAADASDDTGVARVEFLVDGAPLSTDDAAPFACAWDTTSVTDGSHTLTAVAFDAAGNSRRADRTVTVTNAPPPPPPPANVAPTVKLTSPVANAVYSDSLLFAADATDDAGVTRVEFYVDGVLRAVDTTAAYRVLWQVPKSFAKSSHTVYAKAYDAQGLTAVSATVTVRYLKSAPSATMSRTGAKRRCALRKSRAARRSCAAKRRRAARAR